MSNFSSERERRLWLWTLACVAGIYSTLGVAHALAGFLRSQELLGAAFFLGLLLVAASVVAHALRVRAGRLEIGVGLGVAAVYLLTMLRVSVMEERSHLIEYSVVAGFMYAALLERASHGRRVPLPALLAIGGTALVGVVDECVQFFLPRRVFDFEDMLFNVLAAVMAVSASAALRWARRRVGRHLGARTR